MVGRALLVVCGALVLAIVVVGMMEGGSSDMTAVVTETEASTWLLGESGNKLILPFSIALTLLLASTSALVERAVVSLLLSGWGVSVGTTGGGFLRMPLIPMSTSRRVLCSMVGEGRWWSELVSASLDRQEKK